MTAETLDFQAEVSKLLHIVTHSLYSEKEIFLRELISNASDACERLRYLAIAKPALIADDPNFKIHVTVDAKAKTLTVEDNGVGMTRDELIENLGTIARSGSTAFLEQLSGDTEKDLSLIGQFGVGFYSAFMVADSVEVLSRRAGESTAYLWRSDGSGTFEIDEAERAVRGTTVSLTLRKDAKEFLDVNRIRRIIQTYSDHIALPIIVREAGESEEGEQDQPVNQASALWTRPKSEISAESYREFYHHVAHSLDEPWLTIHAKAEGKIEYTFLLFVPSTPPFDLFHPDRKHHVRLYVKRVFITDDCEDLLPAYLRFLRGIVDSEDLPLNVSREMLQNNPVVTRIRSALVKKVLGELEKAAKKDGEGFVEFWDNFGAVLKEGLYEDADNRERILKLARFQSTAGEKPTTLSAYVERMKAGQKSIYYLTGDDVDALAKSPHLEGFAEKGVEVLLLDDPVDDFWLGVVPEFDGKPFRSITRGATELSAIEAEDKAKPDEPALEGAELATLVAAFKQSLGETVKDVRASERLTGSPVCLIADEGDLDIHLERLLRAHKQLDQAANRILEINPRHKLIKALAARVKEKGVDADVEEAGRLLFDQARIIEGEMPSDPAAFSRRMSDLMVKIFSA